MSEVNMQASYMGTVLTPQGLREVVRGSLKALVPWSKEFDCLAFRGMSGSVVAPSVAYKLNKHCILVRKRDDNHSSLMVEGPVNLHRYIIVDDFISTGSTVETIQDRVKTFNPESVCVGVLLYKSDHYYSTAIEYFCRQPHLKWIQLGSLEERAKMLLGQTRTHSECYLAGRGNSVSDFLYKAEDSQISVVEACFPRQEDRQDVTETAAWAELEALIERQKTRPSREKEQTIVANESIEGVLEKVLDGMPMLKVQWES